MQQVFSMLLHTKLLMRNCTLYFCILDNFEPRKNINRYHLSVLNEVPSSLFNLSSKDRISSFDGISLGKLA